MTAGDCTTTPSSCHGTPRTPQTFGGRTPGVIHLTPRKRATGSPDSESGANQPRDTILGWLRSFVERSEVRLPTTNDDHTGFHRKRIGRSQVVPSVEPSAERRLVAVIRVLERPSTCLDDVGSSPSVRSWWVINEIGSGDRRGTTDPQWIYHSTHHSTRMVDVRESTATLLEEKPELEAGLRAILDVDEQNEQWEFEDVPLDSGAFGEVVSRDIVLNVGGGYRVSDRSAVAAALGEDQLDDGAVDGSHLPELDVRVPAVDRRAVLSTGGSLLLVVLFRVVMYPAVFRNGDVVLSSNDPYFYRFWVEAVVARKGGVLDPSALGTLPDGIQTAEPLLVATLWFVSELLGGGTDVVGGVLAWYPVVSAAVVAALLYALASAVTGDRRVAVAAVAFLAITPAHAMRTGIGFADHHAFDYVWLVLTAFALVLLAGRDVSEDGTRVSIAALAVGITGQVLSWDAGPLLMLPVGLYIAVRVVSDIDAGESPLGQNLGVLAGVGVAAALTYVIYLSLDWHTTIVAATPALLFACSTVVVLVAEVLHRRGESGRRMLEVNLAGAFLAIVAAFALPARFTAVFFRGIDFLMYKEGVAETLPMFSGRQGSLIAPFLELGFAPIFAVPVVVWVARSCIVEHRPRWLLAIVYTGYFAVLATIQVRFAGELAPFLSLFAGLGFVHAAAWIDLTAAPSDLDRGGGVDGSDRDPTNRNPSGTDGTSPDLGRRNTLHLAGSFLGAGSLGLINTPLKHDMVRVGESSYRAAKWMGARAGELGWTYPENYVFSPWSTNRFYNYFVNGQSSSYGYAQENYSTFISSTNGVHWFDRLAARVGFVVTEDNDVLSARFDDRLYNRLHEQFGAGAGNFRAVFASEDGSVKVFRPVPGVRITGPADEAAEVAVSGQVDIPGKRFEFAPDPDVQHGVYETTIPYPLEVGIHDEALTVTDDDIETGRTISQFSGDGVGHWSFDEGEGTTAYDRVGGYHMRGLDGRWHDGEADSSAVRIGGEGHRPWARVDGVDVDESTSLTVGVTLRGPLAMNDEQYPKLVRLVSPTGTVAGLWGRLDVGDVGVRINDSTGTVTRNFSVERTSFDDWTSLVAVLDRAEDELRLYEDGTLARAVDAADVGALGSIERVVVGSLATPTGDPALVGDLRIYDSAVRIQEVLPQGVGGN